MSSFNPKLFRGFKEFVMSRSPSVLIDDAEQRLAVGGIPSVLEDPGTSNLVVIPKSFVCADNDEVEALYISPEGSVFIWTKNMVIWSERCGAEKLQRMPRNPPQYKGDDGYDPL